MREGDSVKERGGTPDCKGYVLVFTCKYMTVLIHTWQLLSKQSILERSPDDLISDTTNLLESFFINACY